MKLLHILALFGLTLTAAAASAAEPATYMVGVAKVDITPDFPVRLNGFAGRLEESSGVTQPIYAKALAFGADEEQPALLITVDILGVPADIAAKVAARLAAKAKIAPERIAFSASHTHTAPMLSGANITLFGVPIPPEHLAHIDRYTETFIDKLEQVALAALADRKPATLSWTIGSVGFAKNRRTAGGPVDHDLPLLVVRAPDGAVRALYTSYACHCVTLSDYRISGDWAGFAQQALERRHPGAIAMTSIGCGADANPSSGVTGDRADIAAQQGQEIADEVDRLLKTQLKPLSGKLTIGVRTLRLPFDTHPTRQQWEERVKQGGAVGHHASVQLARLDRGEALRSEIVYPIQTWSFGNELAMAFLPGEVVVDYSLRLKRELDGLRLWVNSYSNDSPGYIPSERIWREGGYEGADAMIYYDQPTRFKPGLEQPIVDAVHALLDKDFKPVLDPQGIDQTRPLPPQASLKAIQARGGFVVELAVAEPLVTSPVAIDFAPDGQMWVAEMYDYPSGLDGNFQPGGRIRLLSDQNGDGQFDHAQVFLEEIPFPTGVTAWRDGVLVCAAPDILYAEDTDGDGRADRRRVLFTGFGTDNYQGRVNSLCYGLDGWVYGSCGLFGGEITNFRGQKFALGDRDFRIRPDTGELEPATGRTQQGRPRDDWGNWFGCDSGTLAWHYVLEDHVLRRNPHLIPPNPANFLPDYPDAGRLFSIGQPSLYKLSGPANSPTAVCGLGIYRDELLGDGFAANAFTCEPVNHLVHRLVVEPRGATFAGHRAAGEEQAEFLVSTDFWFRPVQARTGPDGGLYVVDMYRYLIEHPRWVPPEDLAKIDQRAGSNLGRIYRIYHRDRPPRPIARLDKLDGAGLAAALDTPNGPQRDLAAQMLVWRKDMSSVPVLRNLCQAQRPATRMQALCTLAELGALDGQQTIAALSDVHPAVRRQAVRLLPATAASLGALDRNRLVADESTLVRMAVAAKLGELSGPRAAAMLVELLGDDDTYLTAVVFSSLHAKNIADVLAVAIATQSKQGGEPGPWFVEIVRQSAILGDAKTLGKVIDFALADSVKLLEPWRQSLLAGLIPLLESRTKELNQQSARRLDSALARARQTTLDDQLEESVRAAAIGLLGRREARSVEDLATLASLLAPQHSPALQAAAVGALLRIPAAASADVLLEHWTSLGPATRQLALDALLSRDAWIPKLLDALEQGTIPSAQLDAARRERLIQHPDTELAARAVAVLQQGNTDRQSIVSEYQDVLSLPGDRLRGREVFAKRCSICHRLEEAGHAVGPELAVYAVKPPQALLIAVLDPNQAVDNRYASYTAVTTDGLTVTGILTNESGGSITLSQQEGKRADILRSDIDQLQATGKSLMPEGLERDLTRQDLADLIAYFGGLEVPSKQFAGNEPRVVRPGDDGALVLPATAAAIYGGDIAFEPAFGNIGMWHAEADLAVWSFDLADDRQFDVLLDYACHDDSAGNPFQLEAQGTCIEGKIAGTGGWEHYTQVRLGSLALRKGAGRLTFKAGGPVRGALVDLRQLTLVPAGQSSATNSTAPQPADPRTLAAAILDDGQDAGLRERIISDHPQLAATVVAAMTVDMPADATEEYRRIPWIWRVAIAAGKSNEARRLVELLEVSLPVGDQPLRDWQAVVIGGGIINGLSQQSVWPAARLAELLKQRDDLAARLGAALQLASTMADNEKVPTGTRYDALRMLGIAPWERRGRQLATYLAAETNGELQMGAVSGLVDVPGPESARALLEHVADLTEPNRALALDGLLRGDDRRAMLLDAIEAGRVAPALLGDARRQALLDEGSAALRSRARKLLAE
ncbi:MAG: HEAT repeat domain-containing protein [Pirellulales bacterium]|nr:HEAT repeat domain-containing protein [Pirellulales bacterium]